MNTSTCCYGQLSNLSLTIFRESEFSENPYASQERKEIHTDTWKHMLTKIMKQLR